MEWKQGRVGGVERMGSGYSYLSFTMNFTTLLVPPIDQTLQGVRKTRGWGWRVQQGCCKESILGQPEGQHTGGKWVSSQSNGDLTHLPKDLQGLSGLIAEARGMGHMDSFGFIMG